MRHPREYAMIERLKELSLRPENFGKEVQAGLRDGLEVFVFRNGSLIVYINRGIIQGLAQA